MSAQPIVARDADALAQERAGLAGEDGEPDRSSLERALERIAELAAELDAKPRFPERSFEQLRAAGVVQAPADRGRAGLIAEAALVRAVAAADASVARILDGHLNGVERLALLAGEDVREPELAAIARGELLLGVWGADPAPGEGPPARVVTRADGSLALRGVKTYCSGAGGVQRALVIARDDREQRRIAYVDTTRGTELDRAWYRASGLRASESHRVEFDDAPVLTLLGGAEEIMREPHFSRDALRTAATWAGIADRILDATLAALGGRALDELRLRSLGRMRVARSSIDLWLAHAIAPLDRAPERSQGGEGPRPEMGSRWRALSSECRLALADAARTIAAEAALVCGSHELVLGGALDRARRDLDLFLLQHRLEPKLVELGAQTLAERGAGEDR